MFKALQIDVVPAHMHHSQCILLRCCVIPSIGQKPILKANLNSPFRQEKGKVRTCCFSWDIILLGAYVHRFNFLHPQKSAFIKKITCIDFVGSTKF